MSTIEEWLRSRPSLTGSAPALGPLPDDPRDLFVGWLEQADAAGTPEPHAATLATLDQDGVPDARTLILKDVGPRGWAFAGRRASRKGAQLAAFPVAALDFWWQPVARAVRLRGQVTEASAEESAADLAARSPSARAGVDDWQRWWLHPVRIEFWQGSPDRRHTRIIYDRAPNGWAHREERS